MFLTYYWTVAIYLSLALSIDFVTTTVEECFLKEQQGVYYSKNASNSYGEILNISRSKNSEECRRRCCGSGKCNLMMFSTVLRNKGSTNITCFLFNCPEITRCKTRRLPENITGISIIGVKEEDMVQASLNNTSKHNNSNVEKPHSTTEAVLLRTVSASVDAVNGGTNVSSLLHSHQASKSSHSSTTTSHAPKGGRKSRRKFSEQESHTTRVSLVLSLIIGVLFFGTVVFLIGRRWSEQCFRRGYSKVDYLLNDYD